MSGTISESALTFSNEYIYMFYVHMHGFLMLRKHPAGITMLGVLVDQIVSAAHFTPPQWYSIHLLFDQIVSLALC